MGRQTLILFYRRNLPPLQHRERFHYQLCPCPGKLVKKTFCSLLILYCNPFLRKYVPRINASIHLHNCDTSFFLAINDTLVYRRGAPVFRQEGRVDIDTSKSWHFQNLF